MNLKIGNNIIGKIAGNIDPTDAIMTIEAGKEALLQVGMKLTLFSVENNVITQREIVKVSSITGNVIGIQRAVEGCPLNDNATQKSQIALEFQTGDIFSNNLTSGDISEITTEIEKKIEKDQDLTITGEWDFSKSPTYSDIQPLPDGYDLDNMKSLKAGRYRLLNPINGKETGLCHLYVDGVGVDKSFILRTLGYYNTGNKWYIRTHVGTGYTAWERLRTGGVPKISQIPDMRYSPVPTPQEYPGQSITYEFRPGLTEPGNIGSTGYSSGWWLVCTKKPWTDNNGHGVTQIAYGNVNGEVIKRTNISDTAWGNWGWHGGNKLISMSQFLLENNSIDDVNIPVPPQTKVIEVEFFKASGDKGSLILLRQGSKGSLSYYNVSGTAYWNGANIQANSTGSSVNIYFYAGL